MGGLAFHFRWSPRSLSGPLGPRQRGGGRGLGPAQGAAERPQPRGFHSRSPGSAGPCSLRGGGRGRARSPTGPLPPACSPDPGPALYVTPRASLRGEAQLRDKARQSPPHLKARALPPCPSPAARATGRAAPLSLLHYCHGRSEQCNNERASVRRGAARAGPSRCNSGRGRDGPSRRAPKSHSSGAGVAALLALSERAVLGEQSGLGHPRK